MQSFYCDFSGSSSGLTKLINLVIYKHEAMGFSGSRSGFTGHADVRNGQAGSFT
jgi:hypothetical protein